jgi:hypothetical protein
MRLYISGPMTGKVGWNRGAFEAARTVLRSKGHFVICPAELDRLENDASDPAKAVGYRALLVRDVAMIMTCDLDGIVLLEGWWASRGARLELMAALVCGVVPLSMMSDGKLLACCVSVDEYFTACDLCPASCKGMSHE